MDELLHAWLEWFGGATPAELWSVNIKWWGRIGQVVQFLSALVVVFEIVGYDRTRQISDRLTDGLLRLAESRLMRIVGYVLLIILALGLLGAMLLELVEPDASYPLTSWQGIMILSMAGAMYLMGIGVFAFLFLRVVLFMMSVKPLNRVLQIVSVVALAIGFHFSLLAS